MRRAACGLLLALAACPPPHPTGLESGRVTLSRGGTARLGFRVPTLADGGFPDAPTLTPMGQGVTVEVASSVLERDAVAGFIGVSASLGAQAGTYEVRYGGERFEATLDALPTLSLDPAAMRRSTIAKSAPGYLATVREDGTVWELATGADASVRVELLSGVRAITTGGPSAVRAVTMEGDFVDIRASQAETMFLRRDGTLADSTLTDVVAVRPFYVVLGMNMQLRLDAFLTRTGELRRGNLEGLTTNDPPAANAIDVGALGQSWLTPSGEVVEVVSQPAPHGEPIFQAAGLKDFESAPFQFFEGGSSDVRNNLIWRSPDETVWVRPSKRPVSAVVLPAGVVASDVFAREQWTYVLSKEGDLYEAGVTTTVTKLPFTKVRSARPGPDVGVFSDGIPFTFGESVTVPLRVAREQYAGAFTLTPRGLPADVTVAPVTVAADATSATLTVTFAQTGVVRPLELELALEGEGMQRTTLLSIELPRVARRSTLTDSVFLKRDGTVWRYQTLPPVQVMGLPSNVISITDNLALTADGKVYGFTQANQATLVTAVPNATAIAFSSGNGVSEVLVLDAQGRVWHSPVTTPFDPVTAQFVEVTGLPPMVDVNGDGHPAALDAQGNVWLVLPKRKLTGVTNRMGLAFDGMPATVDRNLGIPGTGRLNSKTKVLWYTGYATMVDGTVWSLDIGTSLLPQTQVMGATDAVFATRSAVVLKRDGTVWRRASMAAPVTPVPGISNVAIPR